MNILIVRLGALGDIVHAIPAAAALRRAHPSARVDWLVDAKHRDIVDLVTTIDRVVVVPRPTLRGWVQALRAVRTVRYDVAIDLQGLLKSAVLARASGAARVVGFSIWHLREKTARPFYSATEPAEGGHVIHKNLRLLRAIGIEDDRVEFPLGAVQSDALARVRDEAAGRPFALINAGAGWPNKRWPPDRFGAVARFLADECGVTPVVVWGPGEEALAAAVVSASAGAAVTAPPTRVADLLALLREAALMISGDTGPLHLAAAAGTPTVSLFGPTDPERNGPWSGADVVVSRFDRCGCHYDRRCHERAWCLADVSVAEVSAAAQQRLKTGRGRG
jgi:lipopolysaccharide heptosyltransferase I